MIELEKTANLYDTEPESKEVRTITVQTAEDIDPDLQPNALVKHLVTNVPISSKVPLFRLQVDNRPYRTVRPIDVHIYKEGEWFFAENETLALIGSGKSFEEAMYDLQQHIVYFWKYYHQISNDDLIGEAVRLKEIYSNLLLEE